MLSGEMIITVERLSEILLECGFAGLREDDDFDYFVMRYLQSDDPLSVLMSEVKRYAMEQRNSPLYHTYKNSSSYHADWKKIS